MYSKVVHMVTGESGAHIDTNSSSDLSTRNRCSSRHPLGQPTLMCGHLSRLLGMASAEADEGSTSLSQIPTCVLKRTISDAPEERGRSASTTTSCASDIMNAVPKIRIFALSRDEMLPCTPFENSVTKHRQKGKICCFLTPVVICDEPLKTLLTSTPTHLVSSPFCSWQTEACASIVCRTANKPLFKTR